MAAAREWLEPRLAGVPPELAEAVRACLERISSVVSPGWSVPETLGHAAVDAFHQVLAGSQGREAAVRLLAADASLTYAFEAAAELGEDLEGLADRIGLRGRLGLGLSRLAPGAASPATGR